MRKPPIKKNDDINLVIDSITSEGQGVGRIDGFAVFVPGAITGESVEAHIIKVESNYAVAKLTRVVEPSCHRVYAECPVFSRCGGCALQHIDYEEQLRIKQTQVQDAIERLGGIKDVVVLPTIGMEKPWRYRNKGSFPFGREGLGVRLGFFAPKSHRLVPLSDCLIQDEGVMEIALRVLEWADSYNVAPYDESTQKGVLRHVVVRTTDMGERMAVVVTTGALPHSDELIELLNEQVSSLYHNVNSKDTNVIFGDEFRLIHGVPSLVETIDELSFSVSPNSFLQVNALQTRVLYHKAIKLLSPAPTERVFDLYCGMGSISLLLARRVKSVIGVEYVPEAVRDAVQNAELNGITNCEFIAGDCENVLKELAEKGVTPDAIVADPPRKGCSEGVIRSILNSGASRMVYISCNPATLARDLKLLTDGGFVIECVQPVDMFPQTAHVETVVMLRRRAKD